MESAKPNHKGGGQDRLSSLPDDILTEILSRLPINSAVTTSVLSLRWRHLWTAITRLRIEFHATRMPTIIPEISCILQHLTSPKLDVFKVEVSRRIYWHEEEDDYGLESCIHDVCRRNVQQVISNVFFPMPDCLLNCRSLVILDLFGPFARKYDAYKDVDIQLPNLKKLSLRFLTYVPHWLGSLHKSSPLLEDLTLTSSVLFMQSPNTMPSMNIIFPNLKSLELGLFHYNVKQTPGINSIFSIDAPILANLVTHGCVLPYGFRTNPTALVKACIDLRKYELSHEDHEVELHRFSEFFKGTSSVSNLELVAMMEWQVNIFTHLNNVNPPIMFFNLVRLKVTLCGFNLNDCNDFLVSLQCFPNLKHLWVMVNRRQKEQRNWCAPNVVPSCLISKLKMISITIRGLGRKHCWLKFLRYILGNATVLQNLDVCLLHNLHERVERKFCRSLFKLPRSSLTCEVVFLGRFITLSSNAFKIGKHNVNYRPWLIDVFWCYFWLTKRQFNIQASIEDTTDYVLFDSNLIAPFQYDVHI